MKKIYYILSGFIISIILLLGIQNKAYAATASISASSDEVEKGQSVAINASVNSASWELDISTTGGNLTKLDSRAGTTDSGNNESKTIKIGDFSANEAGTYTITLSGYVVDGVSLTKSPVSGTVTITVTNPPPVTTTPDPGTEPTPDPEPETPNFTNTNKTMYASKNINLRASWSTSSKATPIDKGTELTVTATSTNKVNGYAWYRVTYNGQTLYVAGYLLTNTKPEEQKEDPVEQEPKEEPADETPVEEPVDETAEVAEVKAGLKSLEIEGLTLSPAFSPDVYEYRVIVKKDISELEINATVANEGATTTIAGNKNLAEGENLITIVVYNAKNEVEATYQITANKSTLDLTETDEMLSLGTKEARRNLIIFIVLLAIAIIALIVVIILKRRNEYYYDDEYYDEDYEQDYQMDEQFTNGDSTVDNSWVKNVQEETFEDEIEEEPRTRREKRKGKHF